MARKRRKVSIPRLISLIIGIILVVLGFMFFAAGLGVAGRGAAGALAFMIGFTIFCIPLWVIGGIFIFIGRKAIETEKEEQEEKKKMEPPPPPP